VITFRRIGQKLAEVIKFQQNVEQAFKQVNEEPFVGGVMVSITTTATTQFRLTTGLGRNVVGWLCVETSVACDFYRVTDAERDPLGILTLKPDNAGTYKFWVF